MELYFREFGQGPPIVILHGLLGFFDNWQTIARALADNYWVITPDLRNHGRSPHADTHTYGEMSQDVLSLLDQLGIPSATLMGHSMGGKVAMQLALDHPERIDRLVVIDMAPTAASGGHETIFHALLHLDLQHLRTREEADARLKEHIPDTAVRQFLLKNLTRHSDGSFAWKMNLPVLWKYYSDILSAVNGVPFAKPALFVRGGNSNYIRPDDEAVIRQLFPRAQIETIVGAGHWVHADKPQELLALLRSFLTAADRVS